MLTAEDNAAQILVPRLMAAGAALERVVFLQRIRKDKKDRMFLLGEDLEELEQLIADTGDVRLVTIDPITAYMGGKLDSHRATDVRSQLGPLSEMAERTNIAFSAITHPAKNAGPRALDWFLGSQAYIAAARLGHLCVEEMEENGSGQKQPTGRTLFTSAKRNVAQRRIPAIAYQIEEVTVAAGITAPRIVWGDTLDITADEALAALAPSKDRQSGAVTFLLDILANGPVPKKIIEERAAARGFSDNQLRTAKQKLGIVVFKAGMAGGWMWALPQHAPEARH
jgi:putative DNA primase/helicase